MTSLYIVRGAPGSGKTTLGNRLKAGGLVRFVISADDYMVDVDGNYLFEPARLGDCHKLCLQAVTAAMQDGESVAVCNTFTRIWEMQPFVDLAAKMQADLYVVRCEGRFKNVHGVPAEVVEKMRGRFEEWAGHTE